MFSSSPVIFLIKILSPVFIKEVFNVCFKRNLKITMFISILIGCGGYMFMNKPKETSNISFNEASNIRREMISMLNKCQSDGSGIAYASISMKDTNSNRDIQYIDVLGYSNLFYGDHIQQLGNIDMFLNPEPIDLISYEQIVQQFKNSYNRSFRVEVKDSNTIYIDHLKQKLWIEMNKVRVSMSLEPYTLTMLQLYPILDPKDNMIYLFVMNFSSINGCNKEISFKENFDKIGVMISNSIYH